MVTEQLPALWAPMDDGELVKVVLLDPNGQEFKDVEKNARATAGTHINQITKVGHRQVSRLSGRVYRIPPKTKNTHVLALREGLSGGQF